jgi:NTP pyrophosphatase (non-canonical NTP hydrolase)
MEPVESIEPTEPTLQTRVFEFIEKNGFGKTAGVRVEKLSEEIAELYDAMYDQKTSLEIRLTDETVGEAADVVICLMGLLSAYDIDLMQAVKEKIEQLESNEPRRKSQWRKRIDIQRMKSGNSSKLSITVSTV